MTGVQTCALPIYFIAWDLKILLDSAAEVFAGAPVNWAAFHTFRQDAEGIGLKLEQEDAL